MKALFVIVVLVLAAVVGYNVVTTGEVRLIPRPLTAEETEIKTLEKQFATAKQRFEETVRKAKASGAEVTAQVTAARRELARIEERLAATLQRTEGTARGQAHRWSAKAEERARVLKRAVEAFKRELERPNSTEGRKER